VTTASLENPPVTDWVERVIEELSRHDRAVGWNVMMASTIAASAGPSRADVIKRIG